MTSHERTPLLDPHRGDSSPRLSESGVSHNGSFLDRVAEGIQDRDRERLQRQAVRYLSFAVAILSWYKTSRLYDINH
jgi:hypothetical protein